jgi:hypothetical protein
MSGGIAGRKRRTRIGGQFSPRLIEMLESPAYRVLSLSARRVLDRLEIEHGHHGGTENGKLPVTYNDFEKYGIHRHAIGPAIREAVALGFLEVTEIGRAGNAEFRAPSKYRMTYRHTDDAAATDDWRRIETMEQAETVALMARGSGGGKRIDEKQNSGGGKRHVSVSESALKTQGVQ